MKLDRKKLLAVNALGVGKKRILFSNASLGEIKEAITRQDIRDLLAAGAITIKQAKGKASLGRKAGKGRKRGAGKIRKKVNKRKKNYVKLTRKLRKYLKEQKKQGRVGLKTYGSIRRRIKAKMFRDMRHLQEYIKQAQ